jgi:hypothetical protein
MGMRPLVIWLAAGLGALLVLGFGSWLVVTQPLCGRRPAGTNTPSVEPRRLEESVRALVAIPSRSFGYLEALDQAAGFVAGRLGGTGARMSIQRFEVQGDSYQNVCASYGPRSLDRIVVGAHYDTADENPGADDNASGVAGLLALGELLADTRLDHEVELVAYSLEEPPAFATDAMGSTAHARRLRKEGVELVGMISLEMIGYYTDEPRTQGLPLPLLDLFYPDRGNFIALVARARDARLVRTVKGAMRGATPLPVHSFTGPAWVPGVSFSDHRSYWAEGYPALMITDTAFYRNPNYHSGSDLPTTLDYRRCADVVRGVFAAILALDRRPGG